MAKPQFKLKEHLLELFDVFKHERKGVLFFSVLIILVFVFNFSLDYWVKAPKIDTSQLDSLIAENSKSSLLEEGIYNPSIIDPNTNDTLEWMQLGFSKKQASSILKYRLAIGGKFKSVNQIQNIYIIDSLKFLNIRPFLNIGKDISVDPELPENLKSEQEWKMRSKEIRFVFDPNKISFDSLILLGFYPKQASSLIKYREKIEYFQSDSDLLKLYLFNEKDFETYSAFIKIDPIQGNKLNYQKSNKSFEIKIVELNSADTSDLIAIRGVGSYYAAKIIQYRNALGGFYNKNQLFEIKKIPKERMNEIIKSVSVNKKLIKKIRINSCEFKELLAHPYFDYYETKLFFDYKNDHGKFISLHDLKKLDPLPDYYIEKVRYYLIVD